MPLRQFSKTGPVYQVDKKVLKSQLRYHDKYWKMRGDNWSFPTLFVMQDIKLVRENYARPNYIKNRGRAT